MVHEPCRMSAEGTASHCPTETVVPAASNSAPPGCEQAKRTFEDDVATVHRDDDGDRQRPDRIGPLHSWRMSMFFMDDLVSSSDNEKIHLRLGLVANRDIRQVSRQIKLEHLHSLACRGADVKDPAMFTRLALLRFKSREEEIQRQHSKHVMEQHKNDDYVLEELLLDAGFILEQLLQHWEARTRPTMVMRPKQYRLEIVLLPNQIPYLLLQELIQMVKIPPPPAPVAADKDILGGEYFLRSIAIGYMVAEQASEWLLTEYTGPVYHLLHLVYLHLQQAVPPPLPRRSLWARCKAKALRRHCKLSGAAMSAGKALRRALRCHCKLSGRKALLGQRAQETEAGAAGHALLATAWWSYSMIPPARDLCRVGIRLRPKKGTRCLAAVCFRDGVLELPPLDLVGFDCQLLINLVALELEWESSQPLFLSYVVFMGELMRTKWDMDLLQSANILTLLKTNPGPEEILFFTDLGDLNSGREVHPHFLQLAREIKSSYDKRNNGSATCPSSGCLSG